VSYIASDYLTTQGERILEECSPRAVAEFLFWEELCERQALQPSGWLYCGDGADEFDGRRDITADLCLACGMFRTAELHDPCIANLPGVLFACCGHGCRPPYVDGWFGRLKGPAAARKMRELGGRPPARAFVLDPVRGTA
jgi:hypothetical protein